MFESAFKSDAHFVRGEPILDMFRESFQSDIIDELHRIPIHLNLAGPRFATGNAARANRTPC